MQQNSFLLNRRRALLLMGGGIGSVVLHGCRESRSIASPNTSSQLLTTNNNPWFAKSLTSGVNPWIGYAGHFVALQNGLFKAEGVDVREAFFESNIEEMSAFLMGKMDVAWLTSADAIQCIEKDPTIRIVYVVDYSNGADGIVARNIKTPAELAGKTIARENVLFQNVLLQACLEKGGLSAENVEVKHIRAAAAATAFISKQVDVVVTFEPWLTRAAKTGGGEIICTTKDTNLIADVIVTRQSFIETRKADLQAYLKAVDKAVALINSGNAEAIKTIAQKLGNSEAETKAQLGGVKLFDIAMNQSIGFNPNNPNNVMKNLDLNLKAGAQMQMIPEGMPLDKLCDSSVVMSL